MTQYDQLIDQWLQGNEGAAAQHLRDIIVTTAAGIYESQGQTPPHKPGFPPGYDPEAEFDKLMQQNQELARMRAEREAETSEEERIYKLPKGYYPDRIEPDASARNLPLPSGQPMFPKFTPGHREVNLEDEPKPAPMDFDVETDKIARQQDDMWNQLRDLRQQLQGLRKPNGSTAPIAPPSVQQPPVHTAPPQTAPKSQRQVDPRTIPAPVVPRYEPGINKRFIEDEDDVARIAARSAAQQSQNDQINQQSRDNFAGALAKLEKTPKPTVSRDLHPDDTQIKVTPGYMPKGPLPMPGLRRDFEESRANSRKKSS